MSDAPKTTTIDALTDRYSAILLDAYGVLVHASGPLPGARALLDRLNTRGQPWFVVTNDASKLPSTAEARFIERGLDIPQARIVSSGGLIGRWFAERDFKAPAPRCVVLGPDDTRAFVERAGGVCVPPTTEAHVDVVVIGDDHGFAFSPTMDALVTLLFAQLDRGQPPALLLPNPDLIYPSGPNSYGVTAGSLGLMIEAVLARRYPDLDPEVRTFTRLGKPFAPIFNEALRRSGTRDMVLIGDQLATDVLGAARFGIASALVGTGVERLDIAKRAGHAAPTWILPQGLAS